MISTAGHGSSLSDALATVPAWHGHFRIGLLHSRASGAGNPRRIYVHFTALGALEFLAILALMFFASIAVGYTFATFSSDIVQSFAFSRLLSTLFSTVPPVYYPITFIPLPFRYLAYLSPTTYAAELRAERGRVFAALFHDD